MTAAEEDENFTVRAAFREQWKNIRHAGDGRMRRGRTGRRTGTEEGSQGSFHAIGGAHPPASVLDIHLVAQTGNVLQAWGKDG